MPQSQSFRLSGPGRVAIVAVAAASLAACASVSGFPANPQPRTVMDERAGAYFGKDSDAAYEALKPADADYAARRKAARDDIINNRIQIYGEELVAYEAALKDSATGIDVGTNFMSLILNGFGAVTGSATTKSALAAAAGGFTAANGVISKEVFKDKTVDAIIAQMNADFDKARAAVYISLQQPDADYPLARAQTDLTSRIRTIGVSSALNEIAQQATQQQQAAQVQVQAVQNLHWTNTSSAVALQSWLFAGGSLNAANLKALQDWLNAQPEPFLNGKDYPPAAFARGDDSTNVLEPIRQRALADPKLSIPK